MLKKNWVALIEDDADIRNLLIEALESEDYTVVAFSDGEEALQHFKQGSVEPPAVIFCDLIMHKLNGFETGNQIQKLTKYKTVPFVLMSAHNQLQNFKAEQKSGCRIDDVLGKPFELDDLLDKVKQFFS
jgi:twitching motility two-component system response regulator PilG